MIIKNVDVKLGNQENQDKNEIHDKEDENKVTYGMIKKVLNNGKHNDKLPIFEKLTVLRNSEEYKYIEAFDNVVKHRKLIDEEYFLQFDTRGHEKDIRFKKFEYVDFRGNITPFSDKLANTVINNYRNKIINSIEDIGNCINKFLKEGSNEQYKFDTTNLPQQ